MSIIRVFANSHVNPAHVGSVTVDAVRDEAARTRKTKTSIFDSTGQNLLLVFETTVSTDRSIDGAMRQIRIDNALHEEVLSALKEGRDARGYDAIAETVGKESGDA